MKLSFLKTTLILSALLALGTTSLSQADNAPAAPIDFKKTVLPILQSSCFACHVSGVGTVKATDDAMFKKGNKVIADAINEFTMGNSFPFPCDEPVDKQIKHLEKTLSKGFMPPKSQTKYSLGAPLSDKDRKTLLAWVDQLKKAQQ